MSFQSLGLSENLLRAVSETGYHTPTPIQQQAIPLVLNGVDLLAGAQTGTGKTAAFVLPMLHRMSHPTAGHASNGAGAKPKIRALVLTPTRELAAQVQESIATYGKYTGLRSFAMFGGVSINPQISLLKQGVDILVATPGRLLDHHGQRTIDLSNVEYLVLDEADRMLDMGFIPDIRRILAILPLKRQNLLFSATFAEPIKALAHTLLKNPQHVQVTPQNTTVEAVQQTVLPVETGRKIELLIHLIKEGNWFQVLVFTRTKHGANKLAARLEKQGIPALAIHGNKSQNARTRALAEFKSAKLQVLVATDIAARGLDIEQLPHVVNFDLPHVPEDYVHRIGRTGRAGAQGEAISLVGNEESDRLRDIERFIRRKLPRRVIEGFEAGTAPRLAPEDIEAEDRAPRPPQRRSTPRNHAGSSAPHGARKPAAGSSEPRTPQSGRPARPANTPDRGANTGNARGATTNQGRRSDTQENTRSDSFRPNPRSNERSKSVSAPRPAVSPAPRSGGDQANSANKRRSPSRDSESALVRNNLPPGWTSPAARRPR